MNVTSNKTFEETSQEKKTDNNYKSAKTRYKQEMNAMWELEQDPGTGKGHQWGKPAQSFA